MLAKQIFGLTLYCLLIESQISSLLLYSITIIYFIVFLKCLNWIFSKFQMIMERKFQPVIIFSFSRRECEQHAMSMSKLDFNNQEEKDTVEEVFRNGILCLSEEDRDLPAIELMLPLLQRGIAVHHSGLLPVIKELVEILFQEGLVKALFATETVRIYP
jgi:ATP-dependent RNA helicase DOB1